MGVAVGRAVRTSIVAINVIDLFLSMAIWGTTTTVRLAGVTRAWRVAAGHHQGPRRRLPRACSLAGGLPDLRDLHQEVHRLRRGDAADLEDRPAAARARRREDPRRHRRRGARLRGRRGDGADADPGHLPERARHDPGRTSPARSCPRPCSARSTSSLGGARRARRRPHRGRRHHRADRGRRPRSSRCSPTSTRCCAPCSRPRSTRPSTPSPPRSRAAATSSARTSRPLDSYLKRINPQIPQLVEDLRLTAEVSDTYADVMPQIAADPRRHRDHHRHPRGPRGEAATRSSTTSSAFSDTATRLPRRQRRQPDPAQRGRRSSSSRVFAKYAPEFPCLTRGIVNAGKLQAEAFRGFTLHIVLETLPNQPRAYDASDKPALRRGPRAQLPAPAEPAVEPVQPGPPPAELQRRRRRAHRQGHHPGRAQRVLPRPALPGSRGGDRPAPVAARARRSACSADDVPDLGVLLVGPMARGAEVSLR